jgi:ribosomal protein S18 acetylase RimI-like enzyme
LAELADRGKREARLGVDAENPHGAVGLYEGVGMSVCRRYDSFDLDTAEAAEVRTPPKESASALRGEEL